MLTFTGLDITLICLLLGIGSTTLILKIYELIRDNRRTKSQTHLYNGTRVEILPVKLSAKQYETIRRSLKDNNGEWSILEDKVKIVSAVQQGTLFIEFQIPDNYIDEIIGKINIETKKETYNVY